MLWLYNIAMYVFGGVIFLTSFFHNKARLFQEGRNGWRDRLKRQMKDRKGKLVWIHAASLGEFEQGRPIVEAIKSTYPEIELLLTFYSPSGYEVRKNYPGVNYVSYLPLDYSGNAQEFVATVNPDLVIFIKYDFWYHYMKEIHRARIPLIFISLILRTNHYLLKPYGRFFYKQLKQVKHYFAQNELTAELLHNISIDQVTVAGDTRFDRVISIAEERQEISIANRFKGDKSVMVLGSTWPSDMEQLKAFILETIEEIKFIIAPHEISARQIEELRKLPSSICYSEATERDPALKRVLIIDNIGMLSSLYAYGDFAFVGGGFRGGLHNLLEAAVFGIPVFFGKHQQNHKFQEAADLVNRGTAFEITSGVEMITIYKRLKENHSLYEKASQGARDYMQEQAGATRTIMNMLETLL